MSFFLAYFESRNPDSENYAGFSDVGKFRLPQALCAGPVILVLNGRRYAGQLVSDSSHQCANDIFVKSGNILKNELMHFIRRRLENTAIISNLIGCGRENGGNELLVTKLRMLNMDEFEHIFSRKIFGNGQGVQVKYGMTPFE